MALSPLPLSYCTNVHPGRTLAEVEAGLDAYTLPVRERYGAPLAAGLWLAAPVIDELLALPGGPERFAEDLSDRGLSCHTLNAFPYGDFHDERVKENVYRPDWSDPRRLEYTTGCARVLAALLPEGGEGSISTVPLAFKPFPRSSEFFDQAIGQLLELAGRLEQLRDSSGRLIRLAIEPEPACLLETTDETIEFFGRLFERAADERLSAIASEHLGVCFDVCHQAVEFEDVGASIEALDAAGVRLNKLHITCAIDIERPGQNEQARAALASYIEPRYLHQTTGLAADGRVLRVLDLDRSLAEDPDEDWAAAERWRVHFHVPVDAESLGPLGTTRGELRQALAAVARRLDHAPHLEVETYTWEVLPGDDPPDLIEGLARELMATRSLIDELGG